MIGNNPLNLGDELPTIRQLAALLKSNYAKVH